MHYDTPGRKMLPFYLDRWLGKEGGLKEELTLPLLVRGVYSFLLLAGYFQLGLIRILVLYLSAGIKEGGGYMTWKPLAGLSAIQAYPYRY